MVEQVLALDTDVSRGHQCLTQHGALHEGQIARCRGLLHREVLLEVTCLEGKVLQTVILDDSVLELKHAVGHVHINLTVPVGRHLCLDGKSRTPDGRTVTNGIVVRVVLAEEGGTVHLNTVIKPHLVLLALGFQHQDVVALLGMESLTIDTNTILIVGHLFFLGVLSPHTSRQGNGKPNH